MPNKGYFIQQITRLGGYLSDVDRCNIKDENIPSQHFILFFAKIWVKTRLSVGVAFRERLRYVKDDFL